MDLLVDDIPPVTKVWGGSAVLISVLVHFGLISETSLFYSFERVIGGQYWRIITSFLYLGHFSLNFVLCLLVVLRYSRNLEVETYHNRSWDYVWTWFIACAMILGAVTTFCSTPPPLLTNHLTSVCLYLWTRRNPEVELAIFLFTVRAPYLPYIMFLWPIFFSSEPEKSSIKELLINQSIPIIVGHTIFFLEDIYPKIDSGRELLAPPWRMFNHLPDPEPPADNFEIVPEGELDARREEPEREADAYVPIDPVGTQVPQEVPDGLDGELNLRQYQHHEEGQQLQNEY